MGCGSSEEEEPMDEEEENRIVKEIEEQERTNDTPVTIGDFTKINLISEGSQANTMSAAWTVSEG